MTVLLTWAGRLVEVTLLGALERDFHYQKLEPHPRLYTLTCHTTATADLWSVWYALRHSPSPPCRHWIHRRRCRRRWQHLHHRSSLSTSCYVSSSFSCNAMLTVLSKDPPEPDTTVDQGGEFL
jgi:hypothetical protein